LLIVGSLLFSPFLKKAEAQDNSSRNLIVTNKTPFYCLTEKEFDGPKAKYNPDEFKQRSIIFNVGDQIEKGEYKNRFERIAITLKKGETTQRVRQGSIFSYARDNCKDIRNELDPGGIVRFDRFPHINLEIQVLF
jgi:hypothetical protein